MERISESVKFLLLCGSILITCSLIAMGFFIMEDGRRYGAAVSNQIEDRTRALYESDITKYDGLSVSGSDVINFIKNHLSSYHTDEVGDFTICIKTNITTTIHSNNKYISLINNFSSDYYIKPTSLFVGTVIRNKNGVIIEVNFEQQ